MVKSMKKILLFIVALCLFSISGWSQVKTSLITVPNNTTTFKINLPAGSLILQEDIKVVWQLTAYTVSTKTLATATKSRLEESDPVWVADSAKVVHWGDTVFKVATKYQFDTLQTVNDWNVTGNARFFNNATVDDTIKLPNYSVDSNYIETHSGEMFIRHKSALSTNDCALSLQDKFIGMAVGNLQLSVDGDDDRIEVDGNFLAKNYLTTMDTAYFEKVLKTNTISPYSGTTTNFPQNVGINNPTATDWLHIRTGQTATMGIIIDGFSATNSHYPVLSLKKSHTNTLGGYVATTNGEYLGSIAAYGVNSANNQTLATEIQFLQTAVSGVNIKSNIVLLGSVSTTASPKYRFSFEMGSGKMFISGSASSDATITPPYSVSIGWGDSQVIGIVPSTANNAGSNLLLKAGNCTAGGAAKLNGGMFEIEPGQSKDWAISSIRLKANTRGAATAQLNTIVDRVIIPSSRILTDAVDSTLFTTTILAADTTTYGNTTSGAFIYQISVKGTNGTQSESGIVTYTGTYWNVTPTVNASINNEVEALSTGTLAATHTLSYAAGVWTMKVNVNSSLTSPVIRYDYVEIKGASSPTFTQF